MGGGMLQQVAMPMATLGFYYLCDFYVKVMSFVQKTDSRIQSLLK